MDNVGAGTTVEHRSPSPLTSRCSLGCREAVEMPREEVICDVFYYCVSRGLLTCSSWKTLPRRERR